jgi:hypothetical protein
MRFWLVILSVVALLSVMCADMNGIRASAQDWDESLIERMTQDRKPPTSTASSTLHQENKAERVIPVKRIPLSEVRVEVGSKQVESPVAIMKKATIQKADEVAPLLVIAEPELAVAEPLAAGDELDILAPIQPAKPAAPKVVVKAETKAARRPVPTTTPIPEIEFDPIYDEHTIRLPDTSNDGFVGVSRSQQDNVGQYTPKRGQYYNNATDHQARPEQQQRVIPRLFRRR